MNNKFNIPLIKKYYPADYRYSHQDYINWLVNTESNQFDISRDINQLFYGIRYKKFDKYNTKINQL